MTDIGQVDWDEMVRRGILVGSTSPNAIGDGVTNMKEQYERIHGYLHEVGGSHTHKGATIIFFP